MGKPKISIYLIIDFDCIKFFFAFCYFAIDDFILDFFSDTGKSLYCKIS